VRSDNRGLLLVFVMLLVLALIGPMIGSTLFGPGGMWEDADRVAGWALGLVAGFGGLSLLATPAALIVGIILLVRWLGNASTGLDREVPETDRGWETWRGRFYGNAMPRARSTKRSTRIYVKY
jgi:hypothetical protein